MQSSGNSPQRRRTIPLRRHLFLGVLSVTLFVVLGVGAVLYFNSVEGTRARAESTLRPQLEMLEARLDAVRLPVEAEVQKLFQFLAASPAPLEDELALRSFLVPVLETQTGWHEIGIRSSNGPSWAIVAEDRSWRTVTDDGTGSLLARRWASLDALIQELPAESLPLVLRTVEADRESGWALASEPGEASTRILHFATADIGGATHIVTVLLSPDAFYAATERARDGASLSIYSAAGNLLARDGDPASGAAASAPAEASLASLAHGNATPILAGAERLWVAVRHFPAQAPLFLLQASTPEAGLMQFERNVQLGILGVLCGGIVLALIVVLWMTRKYAAPLEAFAARAASVQVVDTEYGYFPKSNIRELAVLGTTLEELLAEVRRRAQEAAPPLAPAPVLLPVLAAAPEETDAEELELRAVERQRIAAEKTQLAEEKMQSASEQKRLAEEKENLAAQRLELARERERIEALAHQRANVPAPAVPAQLSDTWTEERQALDAEIQRLRQRVTDLETLPVLAAAPLDDAQLEEQREALEQERAAFEAERNQFARDRARLMAREEQLEADRTAIADDWNKFQIDKQEVQKLQKHLKEEQQRLNAKAAAMEEEHQDMLRERERHLVSALEAAENSQGPGAEEWAALEHTREEARSQKQEAEKAAEKLKARELGLTMEQERLDQQQQEVEAEKLHWSQAQAELGKEQARLAREREEFAAQVVEVMQKREEMRQESDQLAQERDELESERTALEQLRAEAQQAEARFRQELEGAETRSAALAEAEGEIQEIRKSLELQAGEVGERQRALEDQERAQAELEQHLRRQEAQHAEQQMQLERLQAALAEQAGSHAAKQDTLGKQLLDLQSRESALASAQTALQRQVQALEDREEVLRALQQTVADREQWSLKQADEVERQVAAVQSTAQELAEQRAHLQETELALKTRLSELERHLEETKARSAAFEAREQTLKKDEATLADRRAQFDASEQLLALRVQNSAEEEARLRDEHDALKQAQQASRELEQSLAVQQEALQAQQAQLESLRAHLAQEQEQVAQARKELEERTPPEAYKQVLESSRREIRKLQEELDAAYEEVNQNGEQLQAQEDRLRAQHQALVSVQHLPPFVNQLPENATRAAAMLAAETLGASAVEVWSADERFSMLTALDADDDRVIPRTTAHLLFLALESDPALAVRNLKEDLRTREVAAMFSDDTVSMLLAPITSDGRVRYVLAFHAPERRWTADELNFVQALCLLLGTLFQAEARPAAPSLLQHQAFDDLGEAPHYRFMVESTGGIVWAIDRDGRITFVNPAAEEAYGCAASAMLGKHITLFANGDAGKADMEAMRNVMDGLPSCTYRNTHLRPDGTPIQLSINMASLQDETGDVVGVVVVANNISEMSATPVSPAARPQPAPLASNSEVIWAVDVAGKIVQVNDAVREIYGYFAEELLGQSIMMLSDPKTAQQDLARLNEALADRPCTGYLATHRHKSGRSVELLILAEPQRDDDGNLVGVRGIAIDLSRRKLKVKTKG